MRGIDLSFSDPQQNLDYDDGLLVAADRHGGGEVFRFWESSSYFVVLGRTCESQFDVDLQVCEKDAIPVLRRSSGGGTVLQGPGCLNFSLVLSRSRGPDIFSITRSYAYILSKVVHILKPMGIDAEFRPICDLVMAVNERKFSGNAQRRGREYILHHGTLLYDFDLSCISRYLKMPPKMPDYRRTRTHADFITNVTLDVPLFKDRFAQVWQD
ncbi:MAG: lipoate--protein ligase family protein [Candidatus Omnitrophota bacterium]